ncbi:unnamed protein product [Trifolium pratense]|uniref:Uncharacterized protein n=1 Tax=Trifolium pratense TaxID=57577 RepID=A0ACB0L444_TRIPR|nr:unnamed protein product [Trifolium pratense]
MDYCEEENSKKIPKLPLLNPLPLMYSPERPGTKTPPLNISASVPFVWEEEPGKPKPCTDLVTFSNPTLIKCLELPPKLQSPTTVLEGPYKKECCEKSPGSEIVKLGSLILKDEEMGVKKKGFFGNWRKKDIKVNKHVFLSSSVDKDNDDVVDEIIGSDKNLKMRKKIKHYGTSSFDNPFHAKSPVWTKMCEGWKCVVPWKSEKVNKYQCWWV